MQDERPPSAQINLLYICKKWLVKEAVKLKFDHQVTLDYIFAYLLLEHSASVHISRRESEAFRKKLLKLQTAYLKSRRGGRQRAQWVDAQCTNFLHLNVNINSPSTLPTTPWPNHPECLLFKYDDCPPCPSGAPRPGTSAGSNSREGSAGNRPVGPSSGAPSHGGGAEDRRAGPSSGAPRPRGGAEDRPAGPSSGAPRPRVAAEDRPAGPSSGAPRPRGGAEDRPAGPSSGAPRPRVAAEDRPAGPSSGAPRPRGGAEDRPAGPSSGASSAGDTVNRIQAELRRLQCENGKLRRLLASKRKKGPTEYCARTKRRVTKDIREKAAEYGVSVCFAPESQSPSSSAIAAVLDNTCISMRKYKKKNSPACHRLCHVLTRSRRNGVG
ncbi:serine/arginine repetitive matrix protein 3-like isoform X1 [Amphibalanus amphitrite]|uniref:serine/arginine repetitive matrix protein 3-like isoform X1 n=1 Tax=Amphibalanus amphitrite TaxID=1232801 RepID=UPI001C91BA0F|nr:serine/arginine repetitive matrix protein 3-like isoform X1 [Amphibalanus amphitrite]